MQEEQRRSTSGPHGGLASWSVSGLSAPPSPGVRTPGAGDGSWPASPRAARAPGAVTMRGAQDEVAAYANGTWGFAYPTKDSLAPLGLCEQDGDGEHGQGRQLEEGGYLVRIIAGCERLRHEWQPSRRGDVSAGNSPRKSQRTVSSRARAGYPPQHASTKLDIGDLEDEDADAPFQAALKAEASMSFKDNKEITLIEGGLGSYLAADQDWNPWEMEVPIPIKPWFRCLISLVQMLVGACCIQVGLKEEDQQCQATFCSLLVVCGVVQLLQSTVGVYMVSRQVGAEGEEPRAVLWFLEVVLWISALHAVVTNTCENLKLQATTSIYLSVSALLWFITLLSWFVWYNSRRASEVLMNNTAIVS
eukprot:Tamp_14211.p2 GENE.Tamp_14211~~Tamp_14211.p2  ORF type:complete len:361 (-),score=77.75 Tamp_14211:183-1265(-)